MEIQNLVSSWRGREESNVLGKSTNELAHSSSVLKKPNYDMDI